MIALIIAYLIPLAGLAFLLWFALYNPLFDKIQTRLFLIAICINIIAIFVRSLDHLFTINKVPNIYILRRITTFLNFAFSPCLPLILLLIFSRKRGNFWIYIPIILNTIICFISMFIKVVFYVNFKNGYHRGPLFSVPFIITLFYIILLIIIGLNKESKLNNLRERFMIFFSIAFISFCMCLEIFFYFRFLVWGASAICFMAYYTLLNIHCFTLDPLTSLFNRLMYNKLIANIRANKTYCFALIDINNFKEVNDTLGHLAGDHYLQAMAKLLQQVFGRTANFYRIGGDEFMIVSKSLNIINFTQSIFKLKKEAMKNEMSFAVGISELIPGNIIYDVLLKIDKLMYEDKINCKLTKN